MAAIIVSLVWRRLPAVAEVQRVLAREGLLRGAPLQVSSQAILKRLDVLPVATMGQLFAEVCARLQAQVPPRVPPPRWAPVREHFPQIAIVDGSTLEELRKKRRSCRTRGLVLGGADDGDGPGLQPRPLWQLYRRTRRPMTSALPPRSWPPCHGGALGL